MTDTILAHGPQLSKHRIEALVDGILYDLGARLEQHWADYLKRLAAAGFSGDAGREPGAVLPGAPAKAQGCGHHH